MEVFFVSVLLGAVSGLLAGLFGIGGGLVIVPILVLVFSSQGFPADLTMLMSVATSLATIIITSIASMRTYYRLGSLLWAKVFSLSPWVMLGAVVGAVIADYIAVNILRFIFILFLLYAGVLMAFEGKSKPKELKQSEKLDYWAGSFIGLISSMLGVGGGTLIVPFLIRCQIPMCNAIAVASACSLLVAVAGTLSYMLLGWNDLHLPECSLGYVYLPAFLGITLSSIFTAPMGAKLAHKLPTEKLKRYFSLLLFVIAGKLIWY